ncbi:uncharacterized protein ACIB01_008255 [Guaruba guarouba]
MHSARPAACDGCSLFHIPGGALRRGPEEAGGGRGGREGSRVRAEPRGSGGRGAGGRGGGAGRAGGAAVLRGEGRPLPLAACSGKRGDPGGLRGRAPARSYCHSQRASAMALTHTHSLTHSQPSVLPPPPGQRPAPRARPLEPAVGTRRLIGARRRRRRDSRERGSLLEEEAVLAGAAAAMAMMPGGLLSLAPFLSFCGPGARRMSGGYRRQCEARRLR